MYIALTQDNKGKLRKGIYVFKGIESNEFINAIHFVPFRNKTQKRYYDRVVLKPRMVALIYDLDNNKVIKYKATANVEKLVEVAKKRFVKMCGNHV